jgi:cytochrome c oxidase subunit 4
MSHSHIVPARLYYGIFVMLLALTALTVSVAFVDLGPLNTPIALTIAVAKALLVVLFFMHVWYSTRLTWLIVAAGFFWFAILIVLTLSDYLSRDWLDVPRL